MGKKCSRSAVAEQSSTVTVAWSHDCIFTCDAVAYCRSDDLRVETVVESHGVSYPDSHRTPSRVASNITSVNTGNESAAFAYEIPYSGVLSQCSLQTINVYGISLV